MAERAGPSKLFPNLYVGSFEDAQNEDLILDLEITHIVSVGRGASIHSSVSVPHRPLLGLETDHDSIKYLHIDVLDMENEQIKKYFDKAFGFIEKGRRDGIVLIHCAAGVSRAATICVAYLMKKLKLTVDASLELLRESRPSVQPNDGFMKQLLQYQQELQPPTPSLAPASLLPAEPAYPEAAAAEAMATVETPTPVVAALSYFTCRVCRFRLFDTSEIVSHEVARHEFSFRRREFVRFSFSAFRSDLLVQEYGRY